MKKIILIILMAFLAAAVGHTGETSPEKSKFRSGWTEAQTTSEGNLIAGWLEYKGDKGQGGAQPDRPIEVESPYAILLLDCQWREQKGYYIFDNVSKSYFATTDFERLLKELGRLPNKCSLEELRTCTINSRDRLTEQQTAQLENVQNRKQFQISGVLRNVCYCESSGIRWLDIPGKGPIRW